MLEKLALINWLAVLVAGLGSFFLGGVWYQALFGKLWVAMHGWSEAEVNAMRAKMNPVTFFGGMIASYLVAAVGMAFVVVNVHYSHWTDSLILGAAMWVIVAAAAFTNHIAQQKQLGLFLIDAGFYLVFLLFQGVLLTSWR